MEISFKNVDHFYQQNTPLEIKALDNISFTIKSGQFVALVGGTGSGKSTLIQHINALLKPTSGEIQVGDFTINKDTSNSNLKELRRHVGMVFQFPEKQLFEETVEKDIMFGPKNFGASDEVAKKKTHEVINYVGLSEDYLDKSPFDLSGGQMRRVAIAGVIVSEPDILVLDEPTAGLDPQTHEDMMNLFKEINNRGTTIVLVTHQMEDAARYADEIMVMSESDLIAKNTPEKIFKDKKWLEENDLALPRSAEFARKLEAGNIQFSKLPLTEKELFTETIKILKAR